MGAEDIVVGTVRAPKYYDLVTGRFDAERAKLPPSSSHYLIKNVESVEFIICISFCLNTMTNDGKSKRDRTRKRAPTIFG